MPRHQTKLISIPTLKPSIFRPPHWRHVSFDPYSDIRSSSIPHINQVNFDQDTKTKSFSTPHKTKSNPVPDKKQLNFDPHAKTKLISIQRLKLSHFRPPHQNQVNSDPYNYEHQLVFFLTFPYYSKKPENIA